MKAKYRIKSGLFYLNNNGSRWIIIDNYEKIKVRILPDKYNTLTEPIIRTAIFFESFGNFSSVTISIKGKKISTLSYESYER
jgi:HKD family nuclease